MSDQFPPNARSSKNERRAAAREKARQLSIRQKKRERRSRFLLQGGIALAIVAVLAIVAIVVVSSVANRPPSSGPRNMASDGIVVGKDFTALRTAAIAEGGKATASVPASGSDRVRIVTYVDYLCPHCGHFERTNAEQIGKLVESGAATIEIHPLAVMDRASMGTKYSSRAVNAAACVANYSPDHFWDFSKFLFENQPEENTTGLSDDQIKEYAGQAGVAEEAKIDKCIDKKRFGPWVDASYDRWVNDPIPNSDFNGPKGTPIIVVNGKTYQGSLTDAQAFRSFIVQAQSESYSSSMPTATRTPTPTATPSE